MRTFATRCHARTTFGPLVVIVAVFSFMFASPALSQEYPEPSLTVTVQGDTAVVNGSGCDAAASVTWTLHRGATTSGQVVDSGSTQADQRGEFGFTIDLTGRNGRFTVETRCGDLVQVASFNANGGGNADAGTASEPESGGADADGSSASPLRLARDGSFDDSLDSVDDLAAGIDRRGSVQGAFPKDAITEVFERGGLIGSLVRVAALMGALGLLVLYRRRKRSTAEA